MKSIMLPFALIPCVIFLNAITSLAQIEVAPDNTVNIGATFPTDAYLQVGSVDKDTGVYILSTFGNSSSVNRYSIFNKMVPALNGSWNHGLYNHIATGSSVPQMKYGLYNYLIGAVNNRTFGTYSRISNYAANAFGNYIYIGGTGTYSYGTYNDLNSTDAGQKYGTVNYMRGSASKSTGVKNTIATNSNYRSYGVFNDIDQFQTNIVYGIHNTINTSIQGTKKAYGTYNYIVDKNNQSVYATYNSIKAESTVSGGDKFGSYNYFDPTSSGSPSTIYGVYADVDTPEGYAGYFHGRVYSLYPVMTGSDEKLKENVTDLGENLEKIKKLKPKKYDLKSNRKGKTLKSQYGFLAQDVQDILPDLVNTVAQPGQPKKILESEEESIELEDGEIVTRPAIYRYVKEMDGAPLLALEYNGFIPVLVGAVQEQQIQIEQLIKQNSAVILKNYSDQIHQLREDLSLLQAKYEMDITLIDKRNADIIGLMEDLLKCVDCTSLENTNDQGFTEFEKMFKLHPNPVNGKITIESLQSYAAGYKISITDNSGRKSADYPITEIKTSIDVSDFDSGLYSVSIFYNDFIIATESLIILNR